MNINIETINFISVESTSPSSNHQVISNRSPDIYSNLFRRFFTSSSTDYGQTHESVLPEEIQISFSSIPTMSSSNVSSIPLTLQDLSQNTQLLLFNLEENTTEIICSICRNPVQHQDICRKVNRCLHIFHSSCIDSWLARQDTCPLCRCSIRQ